MHRPLWCYYVSRQISTFRLISAYHADAATSITYRLEKEKSNRGCRRCTRAGPHIHIILPYLCKSLGQGMPLSGRENNPSKGSVFPRRSLSPVPGRRSDARAGAIFLNPIRSFISREMRNPGKYDFPGKFEFPEKFKFLGDNTKPV